MTDTNWALASEGATVSTTNPYGAPYVNSWIINGGVPRYDGDDTHGYIGWIPDAITIEFSGAKTVAYVVVWANDFTAMVSDPAEDTIDYGGYAPSAYTISTWNGASWDLQITFSGSAYLRHTSTFSAPVSTSKIKIECTSTYYGYQAIQEIEAWGESVPTGRSYGTSTASAVGAWDKVSGVWSAAGSSAAGAQGNSTGVFPVVTWNSQDKSPTAVLSNGGKTVSIPLGGYPGARFARATKYRDRGKYYFEIDFTGGRYGGSSGAGLAYADWTDGGGSNQITNSPNGVGMVWGPDSYYLGQKDGYHNADGGNGIGFIGTGVGYPQPVCLRFAIDFEACRLWIGDTLGWFTSYGGRTGGDALPASPTFAEQQAIGAAPMTPIFTSGQDGAPGTAVLRAARPDFRFPVPAGFMPWDDYLDVGYGVASAAGSGVATGRYKWQSVFSGAGSSTCGAVAAFTADAVASSVASSSADSYSPAVLGISLGESVVSGLSSRSVGVASGTAATTGIALLVRAGAGQAAGIAVSYVHSPMREINATSTATATSSSTYYLNGGPSSLKDGVTLFTKTYLGDYYGYYQITETMTWAANRIINGIELYSSAWCDARFIGDTPTGTETFPPGTGGASTIQIQYDTTGSGAWADVLPIIYGNDQIKRTVIFPGWLTTKRIRVIASSDDTSGSGYIRLQELKVFTPVVVSTIELESVAVDSSTIVAVYKIPFESTADASSEVIAKGYAILQDGGHATSSAEGIGTEKAVGSAAGTSRAKAYTILSQTVVDSGVASDLAVLSRSLKVQSAGVLTTSLSGKVTHNEVSSGTASDKIEGENVITRTEESTGQATDTVIGIRRVTVVEISGGIGNNASTSSGHAQIELRSSGVASSQAVHRSVQTLTLESFGFADETLPAPFQGSFPVFWTNSVSTGAATWEGLPFNSFIEADGVVYAAGPNGIFELGSGMDDVDADVPSEIEWDLVDNGSVQMKRMRSVYVNAKSEAPFTVRVANEQGIFEYVTETADTTTVTNHRTAVGRGIVSRQTRVSLLHTKAYTAENAGIGMLESTRRI